MDKLISEKAVLKLIRGSIYDLESFDENDALCNEIKRLPAIQPDTTSAYERGYGDCLSLQPERKTGSWTRISIDKYTQHAQAWYRCSECQGEFIGKWNYCPNCGAYMRGDRDE